VTGAPPYAPGLGPGEEAAAGGSGGPSRRAPAIAHPRSLVLYVYGGFVRRLGGWLPVAALIRLMADLGVDAPAVRSALMRMKKRGLLINESRVSVAGYALTPSGWAVLNAGDRRILVARAPADLEDGWTMVVFSVPESRRRLRYLIRSRLAWLGFGAVAPGVFIAPQRLRPEARELVAKLGLEVYVRHFEVRSEDVAASRQLVRDCWDIDELQRMYRAFADKWQPVGDQWASSPRPSGRRAFIDYISAIADWRRLPYLDPGLPAEVLPSNWEGARATSIYFALIGRVEGPAYDHVLSQLGDWTEQVASS
jgi:phenylacetic acid degradation operon negative regulatory protein